MDFCLPIKRLLLLVTIIIFTLVLPGFSMKEELGPVSVCRDTAHKPQSKVWSYAGTWWAVLPSTRVSPRGTWLWRLGADLSWSNVLHLSTTTNAHADVLPVDGLAHILLHGSKPELISIEFTSPENTYQPWSVRPSNTRIKLPGSETATLTIDSFDRIWIATDYGKKVHAYHTDPPYQSFEGPIVLAKNIASDDITAICALPFPAVGVFWSNQKTKRFGFRMHFDEDRPSTWQPDEKPAAQSALNIGHGLADDHINLAVAADGTLYAAVKTSYDRAGFPKIALLVRRPNGKWDDLYEVDTAGTRPIVVLNETTDRLQMIYTMNEGYNSIIYRESSRSRINFGPRITLINGSLNNPTSTCQRWDQEVLVLASSGSMAKGVLTDFRTRR